MEKELNEFKIEVLTQLAVINNKLDNYGEAKKIAYESDTRSRENKEDIREMQDKLKWISRVVTSAIITATIGGVIGIIFTINK